MSRVIVIQFITLDGIISDPDGRDGTPTGGWAFRHGPETVAGDKFQLGPVLDTGLLLFGHTTWKAFSRLWPNGNDPFSQKMNAAPKLVASRTTPDLSDWSNSTSMSGDLLEVVADERTRRDVIVIGSVSVVHALIDHDLVDEYRLLVFPSVVGQGQPLFRPGTRSLHLRTVSTQQTGAAVLTQYEQVR